MISATGTVIIAIILWAIIAVQPTAPDKAKTNAARALLTSKAPSERQARPARGTRFEDGFSVSSQNRLLFCVAEVCTSSVWVQ